MENKDADRFWAKVRKLDDLDGCWEWTAAKRLGYGVFMLGGKARLAHRLAYEDTYGSIPVGRHLRHRCDHPPCVRPDHLQPGSHAENMADKKARGRHLRLDMRGEAHPKHILTVPQVRQIRLRVARGERQRDLAAEFGTKRETIYAVVHGRSWQWLDTHLPRIVPESHHGQRNPFAKLTDEQVREIRGLYTGDGRVRKTGQGRAGRAAGGPTITILALQFGVSIAQIHRILKGESRN
jgi:hypothetical protein